MGRWNMPAEIGILESSAETESGAAFFRAIGHRSDALENPLSISENQMACAYVCENAKNHISFSPQTPFTLVL